VAHRRTLAAGALGAFLLAAPGVAVAAPLPAPADVGGAIAVTNPNGNVPAPGVLVFNRTGPLKNPPQIIVRDLSTLTVANTGSGDLTLSGLPVTGPWRIDSPTHLPVVLHPGDTLPVVVHFIAQTKPNLNSGTLDIVSDDPLQPDVQFTLSGFWQEQKKTIYEPRVDEIARLFGYTTTIAGPGQQMDERGLVHAIGDEVLSPYWVAADPSQPVTVKQLAAFHSEGKQDFAWYPEGSPTAFQSVPGTLTNADSYQTIFPVLDADPTVESAGSFAPGGSFGIKINGERSDDTLNYRTTDINHGCPKPCGHHMRFWPVRDASGAIVPNEWMMSMDYNGKTTGQTFHVNWDFNDNVYLLGNLRPENTAVDPSWQQALPGDPSLSLGFDSVLPNTVKDGTGQGTGFASVEDNALDEPLLPTYAPAYQPSLVQESTATGTLTLTSTAGSSQGADNTQLNALQLPFDGIDAPFTVQARLLGPLTQLSDGSQQAGVFLGVDQDHYVKLIVSATPSGPSLQLWGEQDGVARQAGASKLVPHATTLSTLDLLLTADPATDVVTASYAIDGGAVTPLNRSLTVTGDSIGRVFARKSEAGVLVSNRGSATPITVSFDSFAVTP
jgi:hypothetical protein